MHLGESLAKLAKDRGGAREKETFCIYGYSKLYSNDFYFYCPVFLLKVLAKNCQLDQFKGSELKNECSVT